MATSSPNGGPVVASSRSSSGVDPAVCAGIAITTAAVEASEVYEDVNSTAGPPQAPSNPLYVIPMDCLPARQDSEREAATKPLPASTPSKDGQLGQQSGRTGQADITGLPIVLGIAVFLLVAAGVMFYLKKRRKRSSLSVEELRRSSRMTLSQTELTEF
uniref:Uncharacterized protein n=1 Tax=Branchiostoma floridae TaxID=7739 RepID=C3YQX6_BRAFL|eukprot:XP_002601305.1 hypothetical protein BRAFLDRAFT_81345 [Branchiostoma floridae]